MKYFLLFIAFAFPLITLAEIRNLGDVIAWILNLVNNYFIPLLVSIALLAFFWRNIVALAKKDELVSKAETKWYIFWGIIAFFVMISIWGIVGILADAFGFKNVVPQLNTGNNGDNLPPCGPPLLPSTPCDNSGNPDPIFVPNPGNNGDNLPPCNIAIRGTPCQ